MGWLVGMELTKFVFVLLIFNYKHLRATLAADDTSYVAGGRFAITQKAFDVLSHSAKRILEDDFRRIVFKEADGTTSLVITEVQYHLSHIVLNNAHFSSLHITIVDNDVGIRLNASGSFDVTSKFSYHSDGGVYIADAGIIHLTVQDFSLSTAFKLDVEGHGNMLRKKHIVTKVDHPSTTVTVENIHVDIHGQGRTFYNMLPLDDIVKMNLKEQVEDHFHTSLKEGTLNSLFQRIPVDTYRPDPSICANLALAQETPEYRPSKFVDFFIEDNYMLCNETNPKPACQSSVQCPRLPPLDSTGTLDKMIYQGSSNQTFFSLVQQLGRLKNLSWTYPSSSISKPVSECAPNCKTAKQQKADKWNIPIESFRKVFGGELQEITVKILAPDVKIVFEAEEKMTPVMNITVPISAHLHYNRSISKDSSVSQNLTINVVCSKETSKVKYRDPLSSLWNSYFTVDRMWVSFPRPADCLLMVEKDMAAVCANMLLEYEQQGGLWQTVTNIGQDILQHYFYLHTMSSDNILVDDFNVDILKDYLQVSYDLKIDI